MGPVRIGLSKPSGQVSSEATKSQSQNSADHQEGRTGSTVPPCSTSTAPSDLATDTPTLSCSSVSLETFSPTPSVLTGGSPFEAFFFFCLSILSVVGFSNFSQPMIASVEACLTKKQELKRCLTAGALSSGLPGRGALSPAIGCPVLPQVRFSCWLLAASSFPVGIIEFFFFTSSHFSSEFWWHNILSNDLIFFSLQFPKFSIKVTKHATEPMGEWKILFFSGELIFFFIMKRRLVYLAFQATVTLMRMYKEKTENHNGERMKTRQRKNCKHFHLGLAVEALAWRLSGCLVATS